MSVLNCQYYGFEYNYELEGDIKKISNEFKNHVTKEHKIDYPEEILMQTNLWKRP